MDIRRSMVLVVLAICSCTAKPDSLLVSEPIATDVLLETVVPGDVTFVEGTKTPLSVSKLDRWVEYENALANKLLAGTAGICEWEILGSQSNEVYVWAMCQVKLSADGAATSTPAVIYLAEDGSIKSVKVPHDGTQRASDLRALFPPEVYSKVLSNSVDTNAMWLHIQKRHHDPEPPLIVLAGTQLP